MIDGGLRPMFHRNLREAQWTPVETGMTAQGVPDSEYCFTGGIQGWIEFKKTSVDAVRNMRPEQIAWLERRRRLGGRACVMIRKQHKFGDELWWVDGMGARFLLKGISQVPSNLKTNLGMGGPALWMWALIRQVIQAPTSPAKGA